MSDPTTAAGSRYLVAGMRTLYEACHESGRDEGGRRCASCCVRDLCELRRRKPEARERPEI
jgi:hypothetical protein